MRQPRDSAISDRVSGRRARAEFLLGRVRVVLSTAEASTFTCHAWIGIRISLAREISGSDPIGVSQPIELGLGVGNANPWLKVEGALTAALRQAY